MAQVALRMSVHDKPKAGAMLFGVVFALILTNHNLAMMNFLIHRNTMYVDNSGADLWIVAPGTRKLQGGQLLPTGMLMQARATSGVAWAEPIVWDIASIKLPSGGAEPITLVGVKVPELRGGPWNMVTGMPTALDAPDAIIFEDADREKMGGLNLGDLREVNGHRIRVAGFTWGLLPFGPALAFTEFDTARSLLEIPSDRIHYVLVGTDPGVDVHAVQQELQRRVPAADVLTTAQLRASTIRFVLFEQGIGPMIGSSTLVGLLVGFAIVSLTMFTSVLENMREFATLKAIGATTSDLAKLLVVQSIVFAISGSLLGMGLLSFMVWGSRSARMDLVLDPRILAGSVLVICVLFVFASGLAIARLRRLEPAAVFR